MSSHSPPAARAWYDRARAAPSRPPPRSPPTPAAAAPRAEERRAPPSHRWSCSTPTGQARSMSSRSATALATLHAASGVATTGLRVTLTGQVSNRSGVGAKIEMRAGSLWQKFETSASSPAAAPADLLLGIGARTDDRRRACPVAGRDRPGRADRRDDDAGRGARRGRARSQAVVVPLPLHVERRPFRVRHRLPRRRRDGLSADARGLQLARPGRIRPHPRRSAARARRPLPAACDQ